MLKLFTKLKKNNSRNLFWDKGIANIFVNYRFSDNGMTVVLSATW